MRDIDTLHEPCQPLGRPLTREQIEQARQADRPKAEGEFAGLEWDEWDLWLVGEDR